MITFENVWHTYDSTKGKSKKRDAAPDASLQAKWGLSPNAYWSLEDISFSVEDGEFFGIAGHTGSGKSTLLQHMNGLVQPTRGRVLVDGCSLSDKKVAARARAKVGLVFQYPENQLFAPTVFEDVAFGPRNQGIAEEDVKKAVEDALRQVDLDPDELGNKSPFELSGGQKRRVAFAGVLAMRPQTLILDEPVAGLDPESRNEFLTLIRTLHQRDRLTVVLVSHSMDDLANLCDRVLMLNQGRIFALGSPAEVFTDPAALKEVGLGVPDAQAMACALRDEGVNLAPALYNTETLADALAAAYRKVEHHA